MKKMIKNRKVIALVITIIISLLLTAFCFQLSVRHKYVTKDFDRLDLSNFDSIMIVAHPDDELIWGGSHLLNGNYLVVCITGGNSPVRAKEFLKAMDATGDKGIMLGYPDKVLFMRSKWSNVQDDIQSDIEELLNLKDWKVIVTHNIKGEYGHNQHILTNKVVTEAYKNCFFDSNKLYYFGDYYKKSAIDEASKNLTRISDEDLKKKTDFIKEIYKSQDFVEDKFGQMFPYENWTKY